VQPFVPLMQVAGGHPGRMSAATTHDDQCRDISRSTTSPVCTRARDTNGGCGSWFETDRAALRRDAYVRHNDIVIDGDARSNVVFAMSRSPTTSDSTRDVRASKSLSLRSVHTPLPGVLRLLNVIRAPTENETGRGSELRRFVDSEPLNGNAVVIAHDAAAAAAASCHIQAFVANSGIDKRLTASEEDKEGGKSSPSPTTT
jgi:hypothetical protein